MPDWVKVARDTLTIVVKVQLLLWQSSQLNLMDRMPAPQVGHISSNLVAGTSPHSSMEERWSSKPLVVSSNLTGGSGLVVQLAGQWAVTPPTRDRNLPNPFSVCGQNPYGKHKPKEKDKCF